MLPRKEDVALDKKDAFNFFGLWPDDIDAECYEEGCTFEEVVNHYGHSEQSVSCLFNAKKRSSLSRKFVALRFEPASLPLDLARNPSDGIKAWCKGRT